ncbi:MAG: response regulator [Rubrivivax sp.]|nr:response regulator [Rubrivivax sp.]
MYKVAILGFSTFERSTLSAYFRLAVNRTPSYGLVTVLEEADHVVVDADHAPSVDVVVAAGRAADAVFVGASAPQGATAWMPRPIDMLHVLRELDAMVQQGAMKRAPTAPRFGALPRVRTVIQPYRRGREDAVAPADARPSPAVPAPGTDLDLDVPAAASPVAGLPHLEAQPNAEAGVGHIELEPVAGTPPAASYRAAGHRPRALLIDDSLLALKYLQSLLERQGVITDTASTSQQAMVKLAARRHDLVFLDVELGGDSQLDGLALCQQIKRGAGSASGAIPKVVLVSAHVRETDRARGELAGCDAYLGKPLHEGELAALLGQMVDLRPAPRRP